MKISDGLTTNKLNKQLSDMVTVYQAVPRQITGHAKKEKKKGIDSTHVFSTIWKKKVLRL